MKIERVNENVRPTKDDYVTLKTTGNVKELKWCQKRSRGGTIRKISKEEYVDTKTGEIRQFKHHESRASDMVQVAKTLTELRDIINTNVDDVSHCRWVTLTYAENMTDDKKLMIDFQHFNERMRKKAGHYEYIVCAEPQGRGAWHLHLIMIFENKAPFIDNSVMAACWKRGFVTVKRLDGVDNVGVYLTAYLGDIELNEAIKANVDISGYEVKEVETENDNGRMQKKRILKGARLKMYPPGFHIYRFSRGIKKPLIERMTEQEAQKKVSADTLTFESTVLIEDENTGFENTINKRYYKTICRESLQKNTKTVSAG